ncbi:putative holin-like toxin [Listeria booriae]|uniref:Putative holin-like toxin n=1 Tax=Listeria booriae TaxID=1552123 RepID=A0A842FGM1_9LIST|nr:putative holin-like toxin [Listeria booriae]MBC1403145.1 putative holin-like toxin [Listeria booriae]MBC1617899.1 putative holin-like toxin [Listeria booriae]MBC1920351.1 putative holin-like toxin [Listeria booriae]MBC2258806.1 putative holin-like toxin [Listeria booriae]MBC2324666.1 putative holin-like toxin [Listeria booriae]
MRISVYSSERRRLVSVAEALQLAVGFGSLLISLIALVIALIKLNNDQKK